MTNLIITFVSSKFHSFLIIVYIFKTFEKKKILIKYILLLVKNSKIECTKFDLAKLKEYKISYI